MAVVAPTFETIPEDVEIDLEALVGAIPAETLVKRLLVDIVLTQVPAPMTPDEALRRAGVSFGDRGPYDEVTWHEYFRVLVVIAQTTHDPERLGAGLRAVGTSFYPGVLETQLGKMMLGRYLGESIRNLATTWAEFNTLGHVWTEFTQEREFLYHFEDFPTVLATSVGVGIFEGMFHYHHMPVEITIARLGPARCILRISW